jgi:CheY-like chemotaxis protein
VLGMVDLLAAEPLTQRQRSYVDAMRASGRHLLSVINDILDFSRIESGRLELDQADFALADVLESMRSVMHPLAVEQGIGLQTQLAPDIPPLLGGDPLRLTQVLLNLVSNAVKFTPGGTVQVRVQRLSEAGPGAIWVRFEVRDTGIGIEPQQLQRLFAPFVQADRSISRQYGGSGLGLAISKRLVELMGGRIGAQSTPGQGSVFHFEVPLHARDPVPVGSERESRRPDAAPRRILVAEDVEINRRILQAALGRRGHQLAFAANGAEAITQLEQRDFDLVLMDVQMPVMDGVEATRRIRGMDGPKAAIPILGLTANVVAREREQYLSAGMNACLMKPFDWDQIAAAIAQYAGAAPVPERPGSPAAPVAADATPGLIDEHALEGLREMGDPARVEALVRSALDSFGLACERMLAPGAGAAEVKREAHDICGTSGMLGLRGIWEEAAILQCAPEAVDIVQSVDALRRTVESTRELLEQRGVVVREEKRA